MLALSEFTEANGATQVVPGSHRWSDYGRQALPHEIEIAEMPAGSGLLYSGHTIHGGGENRTLDNWREGVHVSHVVGWLTPEEALPLSVPWEVVADLSERVQRMLGWRCYQADSVTSGRLWTVDYEDVPLGLGIEAGEPLAAVLD
jgi:ectoine hydroxylase-related dioxygenase (phytanoyl-CoA dioxygenase family)